MCLIFFDSKLLIFMLTNEKLSYIHPQWRRIWLVALPPDMCIDPRRHGSDWWSQACASPPSWWPQFSYKHGMTVFIDIIVEIINLYRYFWPFLTIKIYFISTMYWILYAKLFVSDSWIWEAGFWGFLLSRYTCISFKFFIPWWQKKRRLLPKLEH